MLVPPKECVNDGLENAQSVAVDTSDVDSGDGHETQHEAADPVAQIDNDDVGNQTGTHQHELNDAHSDISAVDEFLAFSLPSDSAAQLARRDAIAKAMDSRQSTTALVAIAPLAWS
ncbi:MAG: hypothetical protein Ct9H300mP13_5960 [Gammaproteobacteria bacterium]|nr:MAG: hypothetical protein Ct9H300mP13_5960 [Gammaproteobacteria bacterium]